MNARSRSFSFAGLFAVVVLAPPALAQGDGSDGPLGLFGLFRQSFDFFTVLLLLGSVSAVWLIASCVLDIRRAKILPEKSIKRLDQLIEHGRMGELRTYVKKDSSFPARVVAAALARACA